MQRNFNTWPEKSQHLSGSTYGTLPGGSTRSLFCAEPAVTDPPKICITSQALGHSLADRLLLAAGLDSSNAAAVVDILAQLASSGTTVILSIHQPRPDILRLMTRMVLLSSNGQVGDHNVCRRAHAVILLLTFEAKDRLHRAWCWLPLPANSTLEYSQQLMCKPGITLQECNFADRPLCGMSCVQTLTSLPLLLHVF